MFVSRAVTAVGRHVDDFKVGSWLRVLVFSYGVEEKSPYRVGRHVGNASLRKG